jgi:hypothetical protein
MATSVQFAGMASGGFVLKSIREGKLPTKSGNPVTFSVQNEGDFCVITNDSAYDNDYLFNISQIDDIPVDISTGSSSIIFGKNIVVKSGEYGVKYHILEYGPAE